jgi:glyoxylase-like metal-dependent hydrolase (beta-lactamase superfamily II)
VEETTRRIAVGGFEIVSILDAVGRLGDLADLYPAVPERAWEPYRELYPSLFDGPEWPLPCRCFLLRSEEATVLVDTGVGPAGLWTEWTAETEGGLPPALDELGVSREDVDVVFLTHLHIDHLGWNTDTNGEVFFPRARYVVHRDAVAFARDRSELPHIARCVVPLLERFELVSGEIELAPGVSAHELPGHYPGHMGVRVESGGRRLELIADLAVHPAFLQEPDWVYVADGDPLVCAETRRRVVPGLVGESVLVACGHYPGSGIGRLVTRDSRIVWEEVAA